jgi:hypothetical protein
MRREDTVRAAPAVEAGCRDVRQLCWRRRAHRRSRMPEPWPDKSNQGRGVRWIRSGRKTCRRCSRPRSRITCRHAA